MAMNNKQRQQYDQWMANLERREKEMATRDSPDRRPAFFDIVNHLKKMTTWHYILNYVSDSSNKIQRAAINAKAALKGNYNNGENK